MIYKYEEIVDGKGIFTEFNKWTWGGGTLLNDSEIFKNWEGVLGRFFVRVDLTSETESFGLYVKPKDCYPFACDKFDLILNVGSHFENMMNVNIVKGDVTIYLNMEPGGEENKEFLWSFSAHGEAKARRGEVIKEMVEG